MTMPMLSKSPFFAALAALALLGAPAWAKKKPLPVVVAAEKKEASKKSVQGDAVAFEEINFGKTLIIEGKVEKPQVQFTLLKEAPPEKEIRFETSFMQNILKQDRENTFDAGERYGRE
jgi:hypothetical protein